MMKLNYDKVVAIDGPSGSGKSTVARELASALNVLYIDTGAMFRALGYYCDQKKIPFEESVKLTKVLNEIHLNYGNTNGNLIEIDGLDFTHKIREHHVSQLASIISQLPSVRKYLLDFQRSLVNNQICVMEGRDIGTIVFPNSFCKFFITASVEIRATRRLNQLKENGDTNVNYEQVLEDVKARDEKDINRLVAPLKQASDAMLFDTTNLSLNDVVSILAKEVQFRASHLGFLV
jgi:cytidylate kinase